ncbi:MAG: hypothetical protein R2788_26340 [Saprospiraceae bacterium]
MNFLKKCVFALLFMGFALVSNASDEPTVSIRSQKGQSFSLHLKGINNETFNVELTDKQGYVLLSEKVKGQDDYLRFYDLKNLPAGTYQLRIENEHQIILQTIEVSKQQVTIDAGNKKEIAKPAANDASKKSSEKTEGAIEKQQSPYATDAVISKIKWINSQKN